jgi:hypothetical protein
MNPMAVAAFSSTDDPLNAQAQTWLAEFARALAPYVSGAYVNVPNADMADWETADWGEGVDRLRAVRWSISATLVGLVFQLAAPGTAMAEPLASCSDQSWLGVWAARTTL